MMVDIMANEDSYSDGGLQQNNYHLGYHRWLILVNALLIMTATMGHGRPTQQWWELKPNNGFGYN